jgi:hypothetical protein
MHLAVSQTPICKIAFESAYDFFRFFELKRLYAIKYNHLSLRSRPMTGTNGGSNAPCSCPRQVSQELHHE